MVEEVERICRPWKSSIRLYVLKRYLTHELCLFKERGSWLDTVLMALNTHRRLPPQGKKKSKETEEPIEEQ